MRACEGGAKQLGQGRAPILLHAGISCKVRLEDVLEVLAGSRVHKDGKWVIQKYIGMDGKWVIHKYIGMDGKWVIHKYIGMDGKWVIQKYIGMDGKWVIHKYIGSGSSRST